MVKKKCLMWQPKSICICHLKCLLRTCHALHVACCSFVRRHPNYWNCKVVVVVVVVRLFLLLLWLFDVCKIFFSTTQFDWEKNSLQRLHFTPLLCKFNKVHSSHFYRLPFVLLQSLYSKNSTLLQHNNVNFSVPHQTCTKHCLRLLCLHSGFFLFQCVEIMHLMRVSMEKVKMDLRNKSTISGRFLVAPYSLKRGRFTSMLEIDRCHYQ